MKSIYTFLIGLFVFAQTVDAQDICDSLSIDHIAYDAFNDSGIVIHVRHQGQQFINYPQFTIFNANADTVAHEAMNMFGMVGETTHYLDIQHQNLKDVVFTGYVQLNSPNPVYCLFEKDIDLCPDTCCNFIPIIGNFGGSMAIGMLNWTLENSSGQMVANGQWALNDTVQQDSDTICLNPGDAYRLKTTGTLTGGQVYVSLLSDFPTSRHTAIRHYMGQNIDHSLQFYRKCNLPTNVNKTEPVPSAIYVYAANGNIFLENRTGDDIGKMVIHSADGRSIYTGRITKAKETIDLSHVPPGIYLIKVLSAAGITHKKIFLGTR